MNPKERAKELVNSFLPLVSKYVKDTEIQNDFVGKCNAIDCALIVANNVIESVDGKLVVTRKYWENVKSEINSL